MRHQVGWLLRANRLYGQTDEWLRSATFAAAFQGGCWPRSTSIYQISRWETGSVGVPYLAVRRYEQLLNLDAHRLVAIIDATYRYGSSTGDGAAPLLGRDRTAPPRRLDDLLDRARSTALLTGADWDELTRRIATEPNLVLAPHRTWAEIAERLLSETVVSDGVAWMQRYEALNRILSHPVGQEAAVAACASLAADRTNQVFVETVSVLDASAHPDSNRHVLRQLMHPTNERAQYGALLASVRKLRYGHFTEAQTNMVTAVLRGLLSDRNPHGDVQSLAAELIRELSMTAPATTRDRLRRIVDDPRIRRLLAANRSTDNIDAGRNLIDRVVRATESMMPRHLPNFVDEMLPVLLGEMLFNPVSDVRLHAALAVGGTPYRVPVAVALTAELTEATLRRDDVAPAIIESLRLIGDRRQRALIEQLITATGVPAQVTVAASQTIGHIGGRSDDTFWGRAIDLHSRIWQQSRDRTSSTVLSGLTYGLGISRNHTVLRKLRHDARMPDPVRTAARWWLNLPEVVYRSADH